MYAKLSRQPFRRLHPVQHPAVIHNCPGHAQVCTCCSDQSACFSLRPSTRLAQPQRNNCMGRQAAKHQESSCRGCDGDINRCVGSDALHTPLPRLVLLIATSAPDSSTVGDDMNYVCARHSVGSCAGPLCSPQWAIDHQAKAVFDRHMCAGAAASAALGGNLGGITSWLFSLDGGQLAAALRADIILPVNGFKRCYDAAYGFGESGSVSFAAHHTWHQECVAG